MSRLNQKQRELMHYLVVGVLTTVVSLLTYYGLTVTVLEPSNAVFLQLANIISWIVSVAFAYVMNRRFVFESKSRNVLAEAVRFFLSRMTTLGIDMAMMFVGVTLLSWNDRIIKLIVQIVVIVANYIFSKVFVFVKK